MGVRLCLLCALAPVLAFAQYADLQLYKDGQAALDSLQWQKALDSFKRLSPESAQLAGALYWRAFALDRMGQRKEALAAIGELRTSYPGSGWLGDARTLETAIIGNSGSNAPPRKEPDAETRLRALADLARTDPGGAAAAFRDAALQPNLPGVRQRSLYDLSRDDSPEARELVTQVARGVSNPDLQSYALSLIGRSDAPALPGLYAAVDEDHKGLILAILSGNRDKDGLAQIAGGEPSEPLRFQALISLVDVGTDAQVAALLQTEKSADVRNAIEAAQASLRQWVQTQLTALRTSPDPKARRSGAIGLARGGNEAADLALIEAYSSEKDQDVKGAIVFTLTQRRNFAALEDMGRKETDPMLKQRIGLAIGQNRAK